MTDFATVDDTVGSPLQTVRIQKTASFTTVAAMWFTTWDVAGTPGAGSLTVGNTANGLVPDDTTAGAPVVNSFVASATGRITRFEFSNSVAARMMVVDRLFHAGSFSLTSPLAVTLASQPTTWTARLPLVGGNPDYRTVEIWLEFNAAVAATATTITVTYTNEAGTTGRSTGAVTVTSFTARRMLQMPLQAGDKGVSKIEGISSTGSPATGSVNVLLIRRLQAGRAKSAGDGDIYGWEKTGGVQVFDTSCLMLMVSADGTASGVPETEIDVRNK